MRRLALAGMGIALLSTSAAGGDLREGRFAALRPGENGIDRSARHAVYQPKHYDPHKLRALVNFLAGCIGRTPLRDRGLGL